LNSQHRAVYATRWKGLGVKTLLIEWVWIIVQYLCWVRRVVFFLQCRPENLPKSIPNTRQKHLRKMVKEVPKTSPKKVPKRSKSIPKSLHDPGAVLGELYSALKSTDVSKRVCVENGLFLFCDCSSKSMFLVNMIAKTVSQSPVASLATQRSRK